MRGFATGKFAVAAIATAAVVLLAAGCRTSTRSGLPDHIRTVEIHIFQNKTMYKSLEAYVTRRLIDRVNGDPRIRVVRNNGDAILTGEITDLKRSTLRETTTNEPGTTQITILATYSLYDAVERRYIIEDRAIDSAVTGKTPGLYESTRTDSTADDAEISSANALADEIIRRTIGMW